jgi:hypothetical protein
MATERQRQAALGILVVVLAFVLYRASTSLNAPPTSTATSSSSNSRTRASARGATDPEAAAPDVHLRALDDDRPQPAEGERNLFRFKPKAPPPAPPAPPPVVRPAPIVPAGPPPLPPIPLKFIGIVEAPSEAKRLAALIDSTGHSFRGGEGDVVAGQYRILKIGAESIEMAYLDGRGRQTIRLSGS